MSRLLRPAQLDAPVTVAEIELSEPAAVAHHSVADTGRAGARPPQALVLARLHATPVSTMVMDAPAGLVEAEACAEAAWRSLGPELEAHLREDGLPAGRPVAAGSAGSPPPCRREAERVQASAPSVTVVVATRERPDRLAACLDSLARLDYPDYEVVVVDNDPATDVTASLLRRRPEPNIRYTRESQRGLAAAHNRGLVVAEGALVAFTDDDVIVDRHWLTEVASAFRADPAVACVTGLIIPGELQTTAQVMLEASGRFGKGYTRRVFEWGARQPDDPLFPFTAGRLGSGANMSFDRRILRELGGFDPATGTGTPARGGDDLAAFFAVLAAGHRLAYQPGALVWHHHRRDVQSLVDQAYGYGVGLGAYLASALTRHPAVIGHALRRAPEGLVYALHPRSPRSVHRGDAWPRPLTRLERRGMALGPFAYGLSRWHTRHCGRPRDVTAIPATRRTGTGAS